MTQSHFQNFMHIVFSTKNRDPWFRDPQIRSEMFSYLAGACRNKGCPAVGVGGYEDHVHLLVRMSKMVLVTRLIGDIKEASSKWLKRKHVSYASFLWQAGYGGFGVCGTHVHATERYILDQEKHHQHVSACLPRVDVRLRCASSFAKASEDKSAGL